MHETRAAPRRRVLKAGSISFAGGGLITCTVRNLSNTGAALEVTSQAGIPDTFALVLEMETRKHPSRVVWRKGLRIGVTFEDAA
jgi:hypothetical protein